jgi:hypothetical protein
MLEGQENDGATPAIEEVVPPVEVEADPAAVPEDGESSEEEKSPSKERREREKAAKARLREELAAAKQEIQNGEARRSKILSAAKAEKEPKELDFADPMDYYIAKATWASEQRAINREAANVEADTQEVRKHTERLMAEEQVMLSQNWAEQAREAAGRYTDFDKVVLAPGLFPAGSHLVSLVQMSDVAGDLAYAIASDRALHDDLASMSPVEAARYIGRMEATMTAPRPRTSTQAPPPVSPVRGQAPASKNPRTMSYMEFKAFREGGGKI